MELEDEERIRGLSIHEFVSELRPEYDWDSIHARMILDTLQRVSDDQMRVREAAIRGDDVSKMEVLNRVMFFAPPQHGKSELVSRMFPAYHLRRQPEDTIALVSYGSSLSEGLSREARDNFGDMGGQIRADVSGIKEWKTTAGGGVWAAGMRGPMTGKGYNVGVIDDPFKDQSEAESALVRLRTQNSYRSTFYTRLRPGGAIIIMHTRWHMDDLAGWLISQEEAHPEGWTIVHIPAIKTEPPKLPVTINLVTDDREIDEPLWAERFGSDAYDKTRVQVGPRYWSALYQQSPTPEEGNIWKREWFIPVHAFPIGTQRIETDWDTAYTDDEANSATAYIKSGISPDGRLVIMDLGFEWLETPDAVRWIASKPGRHNVEAKASGKSIVQTLLRSGIPATQVQVQGGANKGERGRLVAPFAINGVYVHAPLIDKLLDDPKQGILQAPHGTHDDLHDCLIMALNRLFLSGGSASQVGSYMVPV